MHRIVERPAVHNVKRRPPRVVVVEPDAARAGALQQRSQLGRPEAVRKINTGFVRGVFKADGGLDWRLAHWQPLLVRALVLAAGAALRGGSKPRDRDRAEK